jgi:hypothetical protein
MVDRNDEFEAYLAKRKRRRGALLVAAVVVYVGIVAVPYTLMRLEWIRQGTFEIFVAVDIFLAIGLLRALVTHVRDRVW